MSLQSTLSSDQILISGFIVSNFSAIVFAIDGVTATVLFLCGVFIGATLTVRRYSSTKNSNSGDKESQQAKSAPTREAITEVLLSPQVGRYLLFFILVSIILIGGAVLFGGGIPLAGSGSDGMISGTVYDESGDAVSGALITLENSSTGKGIKQTTTESDGTYEFITTDTTGPYAVRYKGTVDDVEDGGTVNFNEPGILSNLPLISNNDTGDDGSAEDDGSNGDEMSTDDGETSDNGNQQQAFRVLNGTVQDSNGDPVPFASVAIEYGDGDALTEEQETGADGQYRFEDVPYEGDIQNITLVWKANEEGYTQENPPEVDLGKFYENEERGIERAIALTQAEDG